MYAMFIYHEHNEEWYFGGFDEHYSCLEQKADLGKKMFSIESLIFQLPNKGVVENPQHPEGKPDAGVLPQTFEATNMDAELRKLLGN